MNQLCTTVPSNLVATLFGFKSEGFFEVDSTTREPVSTAF
jgi:hypothetical protein